MRIRQVEIILRTEPGEDSPHESMGWNVPDDLNEKGFAMDGELVTLEEHIAAFVSVHIRGDCDCLERGA